MSIENILKNFTYFNMIDFFFSYDFTYIGIFSLGFGAYLEDIPVILTQPDNSKLSCLSTGNENYIRLHNAENFTIIQNSNDGFYYFAQFEDNEVIPTIYRADQSIPEIANLQPGVQISREEYLEKRTRLKIFL